MNPSLWNDNITIQSDDEVCCECLPEDLLIYRHGFLFLVQKEKDNNNLVLCRIKKTQCSVRKLCFELLEFLKKNKVQYIRIEGKKKKYQMFPKIFKAFAYFDECPGRTVFYAKIY